MTGELGLGNGFDGVEFGFDVTENTLGGTVAGSANIISGNARNGIYLHYGAYDNAVLGNLVGTDLSGAMALGNGVDGVKISGGASGNTIGGSSADGTGNVISGNVGDGVYIYGADASDNVILGNLIGVDATDATRARQRFQWGSDRGRSQREHGRRELFLQHRRGHRHLRCNKPIPAFPFQWIYDGRKRRARQLDCNRQDRLRHTRQQRQWRGVQERSKGTRGGAERHRRRQCHLSGNAGDGVYLYGCGTNENVVLGNLIGTDSSG